MIYHKYTQILYREIYDMDEMGLEISQLDLQRNKLMHNGKTLDIR